MRLPGLAWLEMYAERDGRGRTRYRQRALFHPHGLAGHAYWWSVSPFHTVVFGGMARNIARTAEAAEAAAGGDEAPATEAGTGAWTGPTAAGADRTGEGGSRPPTGTGR